ncbi:uncharacterized protein LOC117139314 [Drosophila mauritiana]|uniref:Uncharacterized protein LOC117139314 n=1 Tax=Drosophila mauritiana TaxID=7226 RepID=A0A6P8JYI1_DROMA|nr:uncharacterized protein LOC117139314 [Drosophila mauritiana]
MTRLLRYGSSICPVKSISKQKHPQSPTPTRPLKCANSDPLSLPRECEQLSDIVKYWTTLETETCPQTINHWTEDRRQRPPTPPIAHPSGAKQKTVTGKHGEYFRSIIPISMGTESRIAHT